MYCAATVPRAIPAIPIFMGNANITLNTILKTFTTISVTIGLNVFCMPMNHPLNANRLNVAGAAQIRIKKYSLAIAST